MVKQLLNDNWTLTIPEDNVFNIPPHPIALKIPGSVYSCLLENQLMPDPFYRDNELTALGLMENDFLFETDFAVSDELRNCDRVIMKFEGIDTLADITLNGHFLGHTENMHRSFSYEVKEFLKEKENHLLVKIFSPTKWIARAHEECTTMESKDAMPGYSHLRKAHCMFGWDWGPRLPDAGIFRPVELLGVTKGRLTDDIRIMQKHIFREEETCLKEEIHKEKTDSEEICKIGVDPEEELRKGEAAREEEIRKGKAAPEEEIRREEAAREEEIRKGEICKEAASAEAIYKEEAVSAEDACFTADNLVSRVELMVSAVTDPVILPGTHIACILTTPDGEKRPFNVTGNAGGTISIHDPELWWPNGYGKQPLYTVEICLVDDETEEILDRAVKRIGLRTLTVDISPYPDEIRDPHIGPQEKEDAKEGRHFNFTVNGLPFFAMGADYIPEDCILKRVRPERTRALLSDACEAHHNCIRIWGGGYYLDDYFYDLCDELGLVIWQDFMFACASYDLNDRFEENIRAEFTEVIRRLRHHAALGLWCGNNEMEEEIWYAYQMKNLPQAKQYYDYIKIYEYILPQILKAEDPEAFYWPSSPSAGGNFEDFHEENIGDIHYWGVWHGGEPFTAYRRHHYRFLSEFGFQSFPCMATISSFAEPEDCNMFSEIMEMHQRNTAANGKIMNYLSATYQYPKDFDSLVYCTQMLQLDAIRYGVEYFRRIRGTCMGTVIWQLNDNWPVASWASIDYFGRWKALHYGEKRFFAPISITCEEHGRIDQKPFVNSLPVPVEFSACLHVANETAQRVEGRVNWKLCQADSTVIRCVSKAIETAPFSGTWLEKEIFTGEDDERDMHLYYEFVMNDSVVSSGSALFVAPKHYHFANPHLKLTVDGNEIIVHSDAYAKGVCIESGDGNLKLTDNFFDMEKGERKVQIIGAKPEGRYRVRSVYDIR